MPKVDRDGVSLFYRAVGAGAAAGDDSTDRGSGGGSFGHGSGAETVAFVEDAGYGAWLWGWQHAALAGRFETLTWDLRGTGRSDRPAGPYDVETLADDLEAVLADHGARTVHLVGAGLGGMVALRHALTYGRAKTLTLAGSSPGGPPATLPEYERLIPGDDSEAALRETLRPALSESFFEAQPEVVEQIVEWRRADDADPAGWRAQAAAVESFDASDRLHEVTAPALVVHGEDDALFPPDNGALLADGLPRGERYAVDGGHLCFVERSRPVNDRVLGFLESHADHLD